MNSSKKKNHWGFYEGFPLASTLNEFYLGTTSNCLMELLMYLDNDLIESVEVNTECLSQPGYLGKFKRELKEKHAHLIRETGKQPDFLVAHFGPFQFRQNTGIQPAA